MQNLPRGGRPKGHPKSGGRQKGSVNKKTAAYRDKLAEGGLMPLDYMLTVLRDESAEKSDRQWAATSAAAYIHPRLAQTSHQVEGTVNLYAFLLDEDDKSER